MEKPGSIRKKAVELGETEKFPPSINKADRSASLPSSWDKSRVIEALIRDKGLSFDDAGGVARAVEEEIVSLKLQELPGTLLAELVETKLIECGLNGAANSDNKKESILDEGRIPLSPGAITVLERRYLKRDREGKPIEKPEDMFHRVANVIAETELSFHKKARVEELENEFYKLMANLEFMPNSPTLMNAGRELGQLSACFVLPIEDSMESIFEAIKNTALIHKSGGGTGFNFSRIRPGNDVVQSTKGVSSGPISFMTVFDAATETIKQGGTRRGANMGILRVDHPDIMDFITSKRDKTTLNNFNISVSITDEFMKAVEADMSYSLLNPRTKEVASRISARKVFDTIVEHAWATGEPGIVFIDRLNRDNPTPKVGEIESTNPCGEQPLLPYESCNLGSINLAKVIDKGKINYTKLGRIVHSAVHFLDNVIDKNKYPLGEDGPIRKMTLGNRKIGLGVMGFADMLIELGIPYNTNEAVAKAEEIMSFIQSEGRKASQKLAESRGAFPNFLESVYGENGQPPLRNATVTTIAPTGTISIVAGCSSGVEPIFALSYIRNVMDNDEILEVNPLFEEVARKEGFYSDALMKEIAEKGSVKDMDKVPEHIKKVFVTSHEITPEWHIKMQAAFQRYTDNAVSKTVNFREDASVEDVARAFEFAFRMDCKGVTVYRDKSRDEQVLNIEAVNRAKVEKTQEETRDHAPALRVPRHRGDVIHGSTRRMKTGCGNLYVTINEDEYGLFEVFTAMGKSGGCAASQAEATSRVISLALRAGVDIESVLKQLRGISCPSPAWESGEMTMSCSDGIAKALERYISKSMGIEGKEVVAHVEELAQIEEKRLVAKLPKSNLIGPMMTTCPDCGSRLERESGCMVCRGCGFSKCS